MHNFVMPRIAYLEIMGSLTYVDLPHVDTFHYEESYLLILLPRMMFS